jgi:tungstate transport system substrate-binding protein
MRTNNLSVIAVGNVLPIVRTAGKIVLSRHPVNIRAQTISLHAVQAAPAPLLMARHALPAYGHRYGLLLLLLLLPAGLAAQAGRDVILATTTSTQDSGLLDSLVPRFERLCACRLKTIAVGTGQSLALGARGEADVVLVHAPALEQRYVREGLFINRRLVMSNDFVVVGPREDPAGVRGLPDVAGVFRRLAERRATFVSRADSSGTHILELNQWKVAGRVPAGSWYLQVGQGMGATLRVASEKQAYTLADRGTYLALRDLLALDILHQGSPELLNIYHVMEVNPEVFPLVNAAGARAFADFVVSPGTQGIIRDFGVQRFGQPLFVPRAGRQEAELLPVRQAP